MPPSSCDFPGRPSLSVTVGTDECRAYAIVWIAIFGIVIIVTMAQIVLTIRACIRRRIIFDGLLTLVFANLTAGWRIVGLAFLISDDEAVPEKSLSDLIYYLGMLFQVILCFQICTCWVAISLAGTRLRIVSFIIHASRRKLLSSVVLLLLCAFVFPIALHDVEHGALIIFSIFSGILLVIVVLTYKHGIVNIFLFMLQDTVHARPPALIRLGFVMIASMVWHIAMVVLWIAGTANPEALSVNSFLEIQYGQRFAETGQLVSAIFMIGFPKPSGGGMLANVAAAINMEAQQEMPEESTEAGNIDGAEMDPGIQAVL